MTTTVQQLIQQSGTTFMLSFGNLFWRLNSRASTRSTLTVCTVSVWLALTLTMCSSSVNSDPSCFSFSLRSFLMFPLFTSYPDVLNSSINNWGYCCQVEVLLLKYSTRFSWVVIGIMPMRKWVIPINLYLEIFFRNPLAFASDSACDAKYVTCAPHEW